MESPKNVQQKILQGKIGKELEHLGIAGEIVTPSLARSVEELTKIGIGKGYTTVVGIGGESLINKIIPCLEGEKNALGIIPLEGYKLFNLIGVSNIIQACKILKYRRVKIINLPFIEPGKFFLTGLGIYHKKPVKAFLEIDNQKIETTFTSLEINPDLSLLMTDHSKRPFFLYQFFLWLVGKTPPNKFLSVFHGKIIKIETEIPLPVIVGEEVVAKTPITVRIKPQGLKIITSRAKIY